MIKSILAAKMIYGFLFKMKGKKMTEMPFLQ